MNSLARYMHDFLASVEAAIKLDPPELPEYSRDLLTNECYATKTYNLLLDDGWGRKDTEEIEIDFYADTQYNEGFYAFVGTDIERPAELTDGGDPTFGDIAGFRIYLAGE